MMGMIWVVLLVALTGSHLGHCSPLRSTPQTYPHDASSQSQLEIWGTQGGLYAAVPALVFLITAVGLLLGCTWCYRHKDCKLFTASATHLHDGRRAHPPDSGFVEPVNNNISEDNNNGPISLREMQNIANNNAAAYIVSENEERNRVSRESVVEFEPLPTGIRVADPLEHCADWFGDDDFPRNRLQYLREIGRGWFGRVVEGEVDDNGSTSTVAVKILNQNASLEDKARFLDEAKMYRDVRHENILAFITKCLQEDPWILIFELCSMDLQQYLVMNRPKMAILNEAGVPLRLMCDVSSALAHLHSRGFLYGNLWCGSVLVRGAADNARAVLGRYGSAAPPYDLPAPETRAHPPVYNAQSESWCLGTLMWEVCAWGAAPDRLPPPLPDLPCPYRNHLYQVMQLCWSPVGGARPTAAQVVELVLHLRRDAGGPAHAQHDFEQRWQRLKPNSIPKHDEHAALVHAAALVVHMDTAVSRSSSIMSDKDMSVQIKSESLTNLHGSLEDVRNIYLTHNETATLECHQGNISLEDAREKEQDRSDASMDPWLKDIIAGSTDDVSYYKDVSDVIKNLDNILNSEKTSSSESSHQASPSRDNLSLDCKKDYPMQSSMVKSPGITNFQNILDTGFSSKSEETETGDDDELDRDTIGTLSHSFERHSEVDTTSQHTLENLTPDTPIKDIDVVRRIEIQVEVERVDTNNILVDNETVESVHQHTELPNDNKIVSSDSEIPKLKELCVASIPSASDIEQLNVKDCQTSCDSNLKEISTDIKNETKSIDDVGKVVQDTPRELESKDSLDKIELEQMVDDIFLPIMVHGKTTSKVEQSQEELAEEKREEKTANYEDSDNEKVLDSDLIKVTESSEAFENSKEDSLGEVSDLEPSELLSPEQTPESVQSMSNIESSNLNETKETEIPAIFIEEVKSPTPELPPEIVQSIFKEENDTESATVRDEIEDAMKEVDNEPVVSKEETKQQDAMITNEINTSVEQVAKEADDSMNNKNISEDFSAVTTIDSSSNTNYVTKAATNIVKDVSDFLMEERKIATSHEVEPKFEASKLPKDVTEHNLESTLSAHTTADVLARVESEKVEKLKGGNNKAVLDELRDANIIDTNVESIVPLVLDETSPIFVNSKENMLETLEQDKSPQKIQPDDFAVNEEVAKIILVNVNKDSPLALDVEKNDDEVIVKQMEARDDKVPENNVEAVFEDAPTPKVENIVQADKPAVDQLEETVVSVIANVSIESALKENDTEPVRVETFEAIAEPISSTHSETVNAALKDDNAPVATVLEVLEDKVKDNSDGDKIRSDNNTLADTKMPSDNSTVYMDLINDTNNEILSDNTLDSHVRDVIKSCLNNSSSENTCTLVKNESTEYLDLPSFGIKDVDNFLHMEKVFNSQNAAVVSSTPLASDGSAEINSMVENSLKDELSETKVPDLGMGVSLTKLEQRYVPDSMSPFESPTKSHHTDTYDENSSVVLGPFENCTLELFKGAKSGELVDLPKEELLAFSSNFSEMNLETPSPLRDGNFLNEVPDIVHDDLQFDDVQSLSEKQSDPQTETPSAPSGNSGTEKRVSPLTPPNSPGVFLASTSQQKYIVDIDLTPEPAPLQEPDLSLQKEIELNQIELQITSKLAMAENENNMNIEYSGPLTVEGLVSGEEMLLRESDALPESYLAGNGGCAEDMREDLTLDEECVKALRNELELKLPLAQVAAIEPPCEQEWSAELPPPPELIVSYPGALSPIAEETGQQLSAYENDMNWNLSTRTESSESYPEPCNNSTDDVTELPTGAQTYTIQSREPSRNPSRDQSQNNTYTLHRDLDLGSSREITMSADSLNASPLKKLIPDSDANSPIDDKTYTKEEEKESLERISQVSPFLLSPTTDTSAPENSDNLDNATGVSTLSKTTLPTDAKLSKPSETQCLSKATSIDSWCSNDTLYNVEENFDDLAMDPDVPEFEPERDENSESTDTLTHNDDEKEVSHCSTYIIHDSKSEACETFSPDSITANDNYTYTKVKTDNAGTTPSVLTKSDLNDSTKNTTKDLAYGTLMSGMPSYSNCTTEVVSGFDDWKVAQPELVRRSPMPEDNDITPPNRVEDKEVDIASPQLATEPSLKKLESVEISCLQDNLIDSHNKTNQSDSEVLLVDTNSPNYNYKNMAPSVTSTPLTDLLDDADNVEGIPMHLPTDSKESSEDSVNVPNFQAFMQSVEVRPQDLSANVSNEGTNQDTEILLEGESKTLSRNSNRDSLAVSERTPTYSDFENSALSKPQDVNSKDKSSQSMESGISSEDFQKFETSVRSRPQDLSSLIDASSLLLKSERMSSELAMGSLPTDLDQTSQSGSRAIPNEPQSHTSPPIVTNFNESHSLVNFREPNFLINFDTDDETEQPHSIIITETTMDAFRESPSRSNDSTDVDTLEGNHAHDPHTSRLQAPDDFGKLLEHKINGSLDLKEEENLLNCDHLSPKVETVSEKTDTANSVFVTEIHSAPNTSRANDKSRTVNEVNCNGGSEKFATVNFLNETFEELIESNVDDETKDPKTEELPSEENASESLKSSDSPLLKDLESPKGSKSIKDELQEVGELTNGVTEENGRMTVVTEDFLQNEKNFCQLDSYFPLLSDIRFTGPATEIMSTSFTQDSPTEPTSPECPEKRDTAAELLKEWDSDSDSHTSNSSSGEFIWKQRTGESRNNSGGERHGSPPGGSGGSGPSDGSADSGSGSEGDEVEFVPSSWDCRAAPSKSSLRSLEQTTPDNKKRVVFKRQKYHCVYEYPREVADIEANSPAAYLPDLSTYSEWDPTSAEEAELGYGQLFGAPSPLDLYPLRAGIAFGADYDEDFFISSSARPFESLGIMSTTSQFFPGKHVKPSLLERDLSDDLTEDFPPPPSPLPTTTLMQTRTPSLDFTTPDSGVEDITPGSTTDDDFKKKLPETELTWRPVDSASSSESVSPSSPGGEALGGLRHTRDKLKLDLPPSPHIPSPRHSRVFNFVLDKPKRREDRPADLGTTPLVMTDDTPIVTTSLPLQKDCEDLPVPEPTFSTFGKSPPKVEPEQKLILTDEVEESTEVKVESPKVVEAVKGEGTVLDSGDEDSGIESSSKATLERNKTNVS